MVTCDLQSKDVNGSEKSLNVREVWDFNAPKDQWKRVSLATIAEVLGVEKLTVEHNDALNAAGGARIPSPYKVNGKSVRGWNMPPLRDASKSSGICLPSDTAAVSDAVEAVEELAPVLATGELQQETVQDAPELTESDDRLKPELVELEAGDAQRGFTEGEAVSGAEVADVAPAFSVPGFGGTPPQANPILVEADKGRGWTLSKAEWLREAHALGIDEGEPPDWVVDGVRLAAEVLAQQGLRVFPCVPHGKKPLITGWQHKATSDSEEVHKLFTNPQFNLGIACGATSGNFDLVVVDVDTKHGAKGFAGLAEAEAALGKLPDTLTAQTPSGGVHYYFRAPKGANVPSAKLLTPNGEVFGDFQSHGKLVIAPPSIFKDVEDGGKLKPYRWIKDFPLAELPAEWVARYAGKRKAKVIQQFFDDGTIEGVAIFGQVAEDILDTLNYIDPDIGEQDWYQITALLHNVDGGYEAWEKWSKKGEKWDEEKDPAKWESTSKLDMAKSYAKGKLFALAAKHPDYVNPSTRRALERKQTNGSDEPTNGGLAGVKPAVNETLAKASAKALGVLPSVEVLRAWCMDEGAKAYAGDKKNERNKYQFLVSGVLSGDADVVAAYYVGHKVGWDWGKAVFAAAKQAAGYVLTQHQSNKSIKVWGDIDSDGQAKLLDLVEGVFKASTIAETCVNIAGLGSTDVLSKKVRQGVEACKVGSAGEAAKSSGIVLPEDTAAVSGADVAGVTPVFVGGGFGARPAHLGGTAASGGGTDYLTAGAGFADDVAVVEVAPPSGEEWVVKLAAHVAAMNIRHANVLMGGKNRIMRKKVGKLKEYEPRYEFIAARELEMLYEDTAIQTGWRDVRGEKKAIYRNHLDAWRKHKNCRKYVEGVKFEPHPHGTANPCSEGQFNLWAGYAVEPQAGDWSLLDRHIADVVCDANPELYEYVMHWMAYKIQNPAKLPRAALVCRGKKGSGKGTLGHFLRKVFGEHGLHVVNGEQFIGKFNAHLAEKVFVFADEAFYSGDKKHEGVLKALITDDTMMVERKGLDAEQQNNYMALFMSTNEAFAVPATEDERRYCVLDVSDKYLNDKSYFDPLYAHIKKPETVAAFLHAMLNRNVEGWNPSKIPETKGLQDQRLHSLDSVGKWLVDSISNGSFVPSADQYEPRGWAETERVKVLIASYVAYCKDRSVSSYDRKTDTALGLALGKVFRKSRDMKGVTYKLGTLEQAEQAVKDFYKLGDVF